MTSQATANLNDDEQQFVYRVSHDLHAPLRHISSYLQILEEDHGGELNSDAQECIDVALQSASRMSNMLDALLHYSRLTSIYQPTPDVNLNDVMSSALRELAPLVEARNAEVLMTPLPTITGSQELLTVLFHELIDNAIQHNKLAEVPKVTVSVSENSGTVCLTVADNGPGVPEEQEQRIFEMFQRLGGKCDTHFGAGLATAQRVAALHGGTLVYSQSASPHGMMELRLPAG